MDCEIKKRFKDEIMYVKSFLDAYSGKRITQKQVIKALNERLYFQVSER